MNLKIIQTLDWLQFGSTFFDVITILFISLRRLLLNNTTLYANFPLY